MSDVHRTIEAVWKVESTRLIAAIAHVTRDIGIAEELAQEALVTALERWPEEGIPENPAAWLMTAAKRRAIDSLRRGLMLVQKHEEIARELEVQQQRLGEAMDQALDQVIDDDELRLIFTACHPILPVEGRIALTLRLIGGLTTAEIARAFLVPEKTIGQRIFRAKKTLTEAHVPFETPHGDELRRRVKSVLSWYISSSMRDIPRPQGRSGCGLHFATRRCGSDACSCNFFAASLKLTHFWL